MSDIDVSNSICPVKSFLDYIGYSHFYTENMSFREARDKVVKFMNDHINDLHKKKNKKRTGKIKSLEKLKTTFDRLEYELFEFQEFADEYGKENKLI